MHDLSAQKASKITKLTASHPVQPFPSQPLVCRKIWGTSALSTSSSDGQALLGQASLIAMISGAPSYFTGC